ncbi:MAG: heme exporter protein C [Candidatus Midichloriaceae bacterium]|jgi:heme exporter protein C
MNFNYKSFEKNYFKILYLLIFVSVFFLSCGLYVVFYYSPDDYLQANLVKILYLHVPSAWLSIMFYLFLGTFSLLFIIFKSPIFDIIAKSFGISSVYLTLATLITGSIWGKPAWGTWWIWDARLTSMLILLCFEIIYFMLRNTFNNKERSAKIASIFAIFGLIDLPIIKFSVDLWATLHQKSTFLLLSAPKIHISMIYPLGLMFFAIFFLALSVTFINIRLEIVNRKVRYVFIGKKSMVSSDNN